MSWWEDRSRQQNKKKKGNPKNNKKPGAGAPPGLRAAESGNFKAIKRAVENQRGNHDFSKGKNH